VCVCMSVCLFVCLYKAAMPDQISSWIATIIGRDIAHMETCTS
jgi:hypothetical protein